MDILHLKEKVIGLVAYMKEVGYTSQYIWYINHLTKWIVSNSMCYEWQNYADIEHTLAKLWHNKHTFANKAVCSVSFSVMMRKLLYPMDTNTITSHPTTISYVKSL